MTANLTAWIRPRAPALIAGLLFSYLGLVPITPIEHWEALNIYVRT